MEDWDTGPFCRHWADPSDCEKVCGRCGHVCRRHEDDSCDDCDCTVWMELIDLGHVEPGTVIEVAPNTVVMWTEGDLL